MDTTRKLLAKYSLIIIGGPLLVMAFLVIGSILPHEYEWIFSFLASIGMCIFAGVLISNIKTLDYDWRRKLGQRIGLFLWLMIVGIAGRFMVGYYSEDFQKARWELSAEEHAHWSENVNTGLTIDQFTDRFNNCSESVYFINGWESDGIAKKNGGVAREDCLLFECKLNNDIKLEAVVGQGGHLVYEVFLTYTIIDYSGNDVVAAAGIPPGFDDAYIQLCTVLVPSIEKDEVIKNYNSLTGKSIAANLNDRADPPDSHETVVFDGYSCSFGKGWRNLSPGLEIQGKLTFDKDGSMRAWEKHQMLGALGIDS
jgi:hypothetical protein